MNILVLGGTRFFGKRLVRGLLEAGHAVTVATRGRAPDDFGDRVLRATVDRTIPTEMQKTFGDSCFDVIYDNIAYCSNDVRALLDATRCGRYVLTSSGSVYAERLDTPESDFDPTQGALVWGNRAAFSYDEGKRQAERAVFQHYAGIPAAAVRFPYVLGPDDYTERLRFYVEHVVRGRPMAVDNWDARLAFVSADEAGAFLAFLADPPFTGCINGCSGQTASPREICAYVARKCGRPALLAADGDPAPYNGGSSFSLNADRAQALGFWFTPLDGWLYGLLDTLIGEVQASPVST